MKHHLSALSVATVAAMCLSGCSITPDTNTVRQLHDMTPSELASFCEDNQVYCTAMASDSTMASKLSDNQRLTLCYEFASIQPILCPIKADADVVEVEPVEPQVIEPTFEEAFELAMAWDDQFSRLTALQNVKSDDLNQRVTLAAAKTFTALQLGESVSEYQRDLFALADIRHLPPSVQALAYWQAYLAGTQNMVTVHNRVVRAIENSCSAQDSHLAIYSMDAEHVQRQRMVDGCSMVFSDVFTQGRVTPETQQLWAKLGLQSTIEITMSGSSDAAWLPAASSELGVVPVALEIFSNMLAESGIQLDQFIAG